MGPSVGFVRGYFSLIALIGLVVLAFGTANELIGLGVSDDGYPVLVRQGQRLAGGSGDYADFALQFGIVTIASAAFSAALAPFDRN
jgi:hypothetical protein